MGQNSVKNSASTGSIPGGNQQTDYRATIKEAFGAKEEALVASAPIPPSLPLGIPFFSRANMEGSGMDGGWSTPGFYLGSANDFDDLIWFWNLRAADIPLMFVDSAHGARFSSVIPSWRATLKERLANRRDEWQRRTGVWSRRDLSESEAAQFAEEHVRLKIAPLAEGFKKTSLWNGGNIRVPQMILGEGTALGVVGDPKPRLSFAFPNRPYCTDHWFHTQHLVASLRVFGPYSEDGWTYQPPYIPELNEYYSREMHIYDSIRVESAGVGMVIGATAHDASLSALSCPAVLNRVIEWAGYKPQVSSAGLIVRQLIAQLQGLQGGRVFKIPGVRYLIRTMGPNDAFTKSCALQLIGKGNPEDTNASKFRDHKDLYFGGRDRREPLTPQLVFRYLVEKGLFRVGVEMNCSNCRMASWVTLEVLRETVTCSLCGHANDTSRQLAEGNEFHYRRSGVLGAERNAQGAIPVALTLQQLHTTLRSTPGGTFHLPSTELVRKKADGSEFKVEIDFAWMTTHDSSYSFDRKIDLIIGEVRDGRPITQEDVDGLKAVADSILAHRIQTYIMFAKVEPFSDAEIQLARSLNGEHQLRVILLGARELEPYHIYERSKDRLDGKVYASSPGDMARTTAKLYFGDGACR